MPIEPQDLITILRDGFLPADPRRTQLFYDFNQADAQDVLELLDKIAEQRLPQSVKATTDPFVIFLRHWAAEGHGIPAINRFHEVNWYGDEHSYWFGQVGRQPLAALRCLLEWAAISSEDSTAVIANLKLLGPMLSTDSPLHAAFPGSYVHIQTLRHVYLARTFILHHPCQLEAIKLHTQLAMKTSRVRPSNASTAILLELLGLKAAHQRIRPMAEDLIARSARLLDPIHRTEHQISAADVMIMLNKPHVAGRLYAAANSTTRSLMTQLRSLHGRAFCHLLLDEYDQVLTCLQLADPLYRAPAPSILRGEAWGMEGISRFGTHAYQDYELPLVRAIDYLQGKGRHLKLHATTVLASLCDCYRKDPRGNAEGRIATLLERFPGLVPEDAPGTDEDSSSSHCTSSSAVPQ